MNKYATQGGPFWTIFASRSSLGGDLAFCKEWILSLHSLSTVRMVYSQYCYLTSHPFHDILPREIAPQSG